MRPAWLLPQLPKASSRARGKGRTRSRHILSVLVENKPGVLSRVTGHRSLAAASTSSRCTVGPTEDATMSRVTAIVKADDVAFEQITKQLHKLISVLQDLRPHRRGRHRARAGAVQGATPRPSAASEIIEIANVFRAKVVDVGKNTLTIEATGDASKLDAMEDLFRAYGITPAHAHRQ